MSILIVPGGVMQKDRIDTEGHCAAMLRAKEGSMQVLRIQVIYQART
jgi:hypothetical protein